MDCVKLLLEYKADINYRNKNDSVLSCACRSGSVEMVHFIIASGVEISDEIIKNIFRSTILMQNTEIITILIHHIRNINNAYGETFISRASMAGNVAIVRLLLERGANPNIIYSDSIVSACIGGELEVLKFLLSWDTIDNPISPDRLIEALGKALDHDHLDIIRFLVEYGVEYDTQEAIRQSVSRNRVQITEYLIDRGVDFLTTTIGDYTLLTLACYRHHLDMVKLLLSRGADSNALDPAGECPIRSVLHHVAPGYSPSMAAAICRRDALVEVLLEYGADLMQLDSTGKSMLDIISSDPSVNAAMIELCQKYMRPILK